jgi:hypothetical protein
MFANSMRLTILEDVSYLISQMNGGGAVGASTSRNGRKKRLLQKFREIGWKQSILQKRFKNLREGMMYMDYREEELIRGFVYIWFEEIGFDTTIEKTLKTMGVEEEVAKKIEIVIAPLYNTCYTDTQLIQIAIQSMLGYFKPLTDANITHFYNPEILNTWIPYTNRQVSIQFMNLSKSCSLRLESKLHTILSTTIYKNGYTAFFHTSSWEYCLRILTKLNHTLGVDCLDFGVTPSFYVSNTLSSALDWGEKKSKLFNNEIATLLFLIPNTIPEYLKYKKLVGEEWKSATIKSRKCIKLDYDAIEISEIESYDLVYGNMVANPSFVKKGSIPLAHKPPKKQLASKSEAADRFLQECIVGCLFFNKNP